MLLSLKDSTLGITPEIIRSHRPTFWQINTNKISATQWLSPWHRIIVPYPTACLNLNSVFDHFQQALWHYYSAELHLDRHALFQRSLFKRHRGLSPSNPLCSCVIFVYNQFVAAALRSHRDGCPEEEEAPVFRATHSCNSSVGTPWRCWRKVQGRRERGGGGVEGADELEKVGKAGEER